LKWAKPVLVLVLQRFRHVHAALLSAAAGNSGVLMAPYLVDSAYDSSGKQVYSATPLEIFENLLKEDCRQNAKVDAGDNPRRDQPKILPTQRHGGRSV